MPSQNRIEDLSHESEGGKDKSSSRRSSSSKRASRPTVAEDKDLRGRLAETFKRLAESRQARGDDELAEILEEDAEVMAQGLVSLTRPFKPFRTVVLVFVSVVEPLLSFQRLLRVLGRRIAERRFRRAQEHETMAHETEVEAQAA